MSKFTDKLSRLHASRVRALEAGEEAERRVFHADPEPTPAPAPPPPASVAPPAADTAARRAVREQLELGQRLGTRTARPARVSMVREGTPAATPTAHSAPAATPSDNAVGDRLGELRRQADALITAGGLDAALPLLHEMAALSPTHTFALSQLAQYWRARGNHRIAELYAQRLAAVAPY